MAREALTDVLELAQLLRPSWREITDRIPAWHPRCEGEADGGEEEAGAGGSAEEEEEPGAGGNGEEEEEPGSSGSGSGGGSGEPDWKKMARRHEREAKKARDRAAQAEQALKAREDADKSEQEKAIEQARDEARNEAQGTFEKERRKDRLEVATTKLAAKGMTIGSGDDAKSVRFADPDDALLHLERDIRNGDLDDSDIFDDNGRVKPDQLEEALADLLTRKPHLAADTKPPPKVKGSADAGKGEPASGDSSVEEQHQKIRRHGTSSERKDQGARFRRAA